MTKFWLILSLLAIAFSAAVPTAEAALLHRCEAKGGYKAPRGVIRISRFPIKSEWEDRKICLPCGRFEHYKVKVVTYRDRYSNGIQRTWKCVVAGSRCHDCSK